jgi:clan AA aspartic protease (TIGR02281 family)
MFATAIRAAALALGLAAPALAHADVLIRDWTPDDAIHVEQHSTDNGAVCLFRLTDPQTGTFLAVGKDSVGGTSLVVGYKGGFTTGGTITFTVDNNIPIPKNGIAQPTGIITFTLDPLKFAMPFKIENGWLISRHPAGGDNAFLRTLYNGNSLNIAAGPAQGTIPLAGSATALVVLDRCRDAIVAQRMTPAAPASPVANEAALTADGFGTFLVEASINGSAPLQFTLDTGATSVSIPQGVADQLIAAGKLAPADYRQDVTVHLADGSKIQKRIYMLRSVTIGGRTVADVECTVGGSGTSMLLGQSVLRRFKSWSIDNARNVLVLGAPA